MQILVPQNVPGLKSATVRRWLKNAGDAVAAGETLLELEGEESLVQLQASTEGVLARILVAAGKTVGSGAELGVLESGKSGTKLAPQTNKAAAPAVTGARGGGGGGAVIPVLMPQAGNTMEEGTILKWRVKEGDRITVGQVICDIETDKAAVEMEATDAGRLAKIVAGEGAVVPVKQPIAFLAESAADVEAFLGNSEFRIQNSEVREEARSKEAGEKPEVRSKKREEGERVRASPAARKLAAKEGVDLSTVGTGSGPEGRILSTDVAVARPAGGGTLKRELQTGGRRAMSKMRKAIATNLQTSKQTVPHFYVRITINADPLFAFYRAQKPATGCTLNDVILLAVGRCVGEFAAFRSRIEGSDIIETPAANIGLAVSVPDGLVVPVVLNVDTLTLAQLAPEAKRVVEAARNGKIENLGKGVFTISNMGMLGVEEFAAIINPPESGILAISALREAVVVKDGAMHAGRVMTMTLSVDHRVVDGAVAAQFMGRLKELLEAPEKLS